MKKLTWIGLAIGFALVLSGVFSRSPGQIALSTAVIVTGVLIILIALILTAVLHFKDPNGRI